MIISAVLFYVLFSGIMADVAAAWQAEFSPRPKSKKGAGTSALF